MTRPDPEFAALSVVLHKRARCLLNCPQDAADLAQDTALRVWQSLQAGAQIDNLNAYALTALRNGARSRWRERCISVELRDDTATIQPDAPRRIACSELRAAIAELPEAQARLMDLVAGGETSPATLAQITGQPAGTVMSRLARARATLRHAMGMRKSTPTAALFENMDGC